MKRFREYRKDQATRDKYADVSVSVKDFIYPYFVVEGEGVKAPIATMPGICRFSIDTLVEDVKEAYALGIDKVLLFGVIDDSQKDPVGSLAYADDALVCRAVRAIKAALPEVCVITDVCLCEYASHGHCGLLHDRGVERFPQIPMVAYQVSGEYSMLKAATRPKSSTTCCSR